MVESTSDGGAGKESGLDVVTGGAGFIGSHLVDSLLATGRRVRVLDNFASGRMANLAHHQSNGHLDIVRGEVSDPEVVGDCFEDAERVFHLAALADIVPSIQNPESYFRSNVDGTYVVAEACRSKAVRRVVYAASSSCYGIPDIYPTPESTPADPRYPYALTKYLGEQILMHWAQVYNLPVVSLRFFNVYGPRSRTAGTYGAVFGVFLAQLLAQKPLTVVGDGTQTRDFTYVTDVVSALQAAAESNRIGEIYNVGSNEAQSVNQLVKLLGATDVAYIPKRPGEPDCTLADTSRIRRDLAWKPKVTFADGVKIMMQHIEYWRDAPVWTEDRIANATADWFKFLGDEPKK